ncbi:MAG: DUF2613 family protein [Gordonia sp. (in: high G+C Gram-positive bacteria)]
MRNNRVAAGAVAAVAGIVVGIGAVLLGGFLAADNSPATDVNNINPKAGFVQGSVDYGSRDATGANE